MIKRSVCLFTDKKKKKNMNVMLVIIYKRGICTTWYSTLHPGLVWNQHFVLSFSFLLHVFSPIFLCRLKRLARFCIFTTRPGPTLGCRSLLHLSSTSCSRCESRAVWIQTRDQWWCIAVLELGALGPFASWTPASCWCVQTLFLGSYDNNKFNLLGDWHLHRKLTQPFLEKL